jgi:hypothetical protein
MLNQRSILPDSQLKYTCFIKDFKIKLKKLKEVFFGKSKKSAFLAKNGQKSVFFPKVKVGKPFSFHVKLNLAILN